MKNMENMTHLELLKAFSKQVMEYDRIRDDELDFLSEHPNRDIWDDEQEKEYAEIVERVRSAYSEIVKVHDFIAAI